MKLERSGMQRWFGEKTNDAPLQIDALDAGLILRVLQDQIKAECNTLLSNSHFQVPAAVMVTDLVELKYRIINHFAENVMHKESPKAERYPEEPANE